jgi:hypothetical protein
METPRGRTSLLSKGEEGVEAAGFFGLDWSVKEGDFVFGSKEAGGR